MSVPRIPFIVGNWKMNGLAVGLADVAAIAEAVSSGAAGRAQCAICPPATLIERAATVAAGRLIVGGQDCAVDAAGPHTGDVSAEMLRDAGARLVIVGHSERRAEHGETDALVRRKAQAAFRAGLVTLLCVGEDRAARDNGRMFDVVGGHLDGSLPPDADPASFVVAYEPIWAIGTGETPAEADVATMHAFIRRRLESIMGASAEQVQILYGGSVKPANAAALLAVAGVDGALVGGSSLMAAEFLAIAATYR